MYVKVRLTLRGGTPPLITGVGTQGRYAKGQGAEYTTHYTLQYAGVDGTVKPYAATPAENQVRQPSAQPTYRQDKGNHTTNL